MIKLIIIFIAMLVYTVVSLLAMLVVEKSSNHALLLAIFFCYWIPMLVMRNSIKKHFLRKEDCHEDK